MKVDIWSDVRCPFCYIGKRKFEIALQQFKHKEDIEVEWHSFELDPDTETQPGVSVYDYLSKRYGKSREWAIESHEQVAKTAAEVGLEFNFDISIIANSFDAHRLIQLAKTEGLGDEAEEQLFKAYFTEGKDISDHQTLVETSIKIGLKEQTVASILNSTAFSGEVRQDESLAQSIGIQGVPFFIIDQKLAISGAQPPETFLGALNQAWKAK